jgi:hypothetical protein
MTKPTDDLEAVRVIAEALQGFQKDEQERIIRWAREKVGLAVSSGMSPSADAISPGPSPSAAAPHHHQGSTNIRSFLDQKNPKSDNQLAAAVAYYYRFQAPESHRKDQIGADDLQEACRLAGRKRLTNPGQTLINALHQGLMDKGERGKYSINTVGENLVAMILPGGATDGARMSRPKKAARRKKR